MNEKQQKILDEIFSLKEKFSNLHIHLISDDSCSRDDQEGVFKKQRSVQINIKDYDFEEKMPEFLAVATKMVSDIEKELLHDMNSPNIARAYMARVNYNNLFKNK